MFVGSRLLSRKPPTNNDILREEEQPMKKISEPNYRVEFKFWKCTIYIYSESFFFFIYDSKI